MQYQCSKCGQEDTTNLHDLQEVGAPYCADCDKEMDAVEVKNTDNPELQYSIEDVQAAMVTDFSGSSADHYDGLTEDEQKTVDNRINKMSLHKYLDTFLIENGICGYTNDILRIVKAFEGKE